MLSKAKEIQKAIPPCGMGLLFGEIGFGAYQETVGNSCQNLTNVNA